jgi:hypothetical protein
MPLEKLGDITLRGSIRILGRRRPVVVSGVGFDEMKQNVKSLRILLQFDVSRDHDMFPRMRISCQHSAVVA